MGESSRDASSDRQDSDAEVDFILAAYERMKRTSAGLPARRRWKKKSGGGTAADQPEPTETGWQPPPGIARTKSGTGKSRFDPQPLGNVLGQIQRRNDWQIPLSLGSIAARWEVIVGPQVAEHCQIESFADQKLHVRADSTAWAKQLRLLLPQIERRIAEELGPSAVQQVIVHAPQAPSWGKGRYRVPGRGPRDTYG